MRYAVTLLALAALACGGPGKSIVVDGDLAALEAEYGERSRANPGDAMARARLGAVLLRAGKVAEAVKELDRAAGLDGGNVEIARWYGEALLAAGSALEAYRAFQRAVVGDPEWRARYHKDVLPRLLAGLADKAAKGGDAKDIVALAKTLPKESLATNPAAAARLFEAEGDLRFAAGSNNEAIDAYERSRATGAADVRLRLKLGKCRAILGQMDQAEQHFVAYAEAAGAEQVARTAEVARFLDGAFRFDEAVSWYQRATKRSPGDKALQRALGVALLKTGRPDLARGTLGKLLEGEKDPRAFDEIAAIYLNYKQTADALATWKQALALAPADIGRWKVLARLYKREGQLASLPGDIGQAERHDAWGAVWADVGDFERAAAEYEAAASASGAPPSVFLALGRARHKLGQAPARDKAYKRYLAAAPDRAAALAELAKAFESDGDKAQALKTWQELLASQPGNRQAAFGAAALLRASGDARGEAAALKAWAEAAGDPEAKARAWMEVARRDIGRRDATAAAEAFAQALALGNTAVRRDVLLAAGLFYRDVLKQPQRVEELLSEWIESAPPEGRFEARRKIAADVRGATTLQRFRMQLLEEMAREKPDDGTAWYALGEGYLELRPPAADDSRRAFERYIELAPNRRAAILQVGTKLLDRSAQNEAAEVFRKLPPAEIQDGRLHQSLGRLFLNLNDKPRAEAHLRLYLDTVKSPDPAAAGDLLRLANQLSNRGLYGVSIAIHRRLLPTSTNRAQVLFPLAEALLGSGDEEGAEEAFQSYLEATGRQDRAIESVGRVFYDKRHYTRARAYFEALFTERLRPRLSQLYPVLVDILVKLGDLDAVRDLSRRYVELSPNAFVANRNAAEYLQVAGLYHEALEYLGRAAELQPNATEFREKQARLALQVGDVAQAEALLRKLVARQKQNAGVWVRAGLLLSSRGYDDQALAFYDDAIKAGATAGALYVARAEVRLRRGQIELAHADFAEAVVKTENLPETLAGIRRSYLRAGLVKHYLDLLQRTAALYPNRSETYLDLGEMALRLGRLPEARQAFARFVERHEKGLLGVAGKLWRAGDVEGAATFYQRAIGAAIDDGRQKAIEELVAALSALGRPDRVGEMVARYFVAVDEPAKQERALAALLDKGGFVREAVRYLSRSEARSPSSAGARALGRLLLLAGDDAAAAPLLKRYIDTDPLVGLAGRRGTSAQVLQRIQRAQEVARLYEDLGRDDRALAVIEAIAAEQPGLGRLHVHHARLRLQRGDVLGAMDALEALVTSPNIDVTAGPDLDGLYQLIRDLGRERETLEVLRRTPTEDRPFDLSIALVRLALRQDDRATATAEVARILAQATQGERWLAVAAAWYEAGHLDEAATHLRAVLEPSRGTSAVAGAARTLLLIGLARQDDSAADEVEALLGRVFEDRRQLHKTLMEVMQSVGLLDRAVAHGLEWKAALGRRPVAGDLLRPSQPEPWRALALLHHVRGDGEAVRKVVAEYLSLADDPRTARRSMARLLEGHFETALALELYEAAADADLGDRRMRFRAGVLSLAQNDAPRAKAHFDKYLAAAEDRPSSLRRVAAAYAAAEQPAEAERLYAEAGPARVRGDLRHVIFQLRRGETAKAQAVVDASVAKAVDPLLAEVRFGALYFEVPMSPAMALALADRAIARRPDAPHPVAVLTRAAALAELGKDDEARKAFDAVTKAGGADIAALFARAAAVDPGRKARSARLLAKKALHGRRLELAKWALDRSLVGEKTAEALLAAVSLVREALAEASSSWTEADRRQAAELGLAYAARVRGRSDAIVPVASVVSELWEQSGDVEAAIHVFREAIRRFPDQSSLYNNLAYLFARRGRDLDEALQLVRTAMALAPEQALFYEDTEGWVLYQLGRYEEARERLESAARRLTARAGEAASETLYHLGATLVKLGKTEDARAALLRSRRADPASAAGRLAAELLKTLR